MSKYSKETPSQMSRTGSLIFDLYRTHLRSELSGFEHFQRNCYRHILLKSATKATAVHRFYRSCKTRLGNGPFELGFVPVQMNPLLLLASGRY
jgi:hypothetical protein